MYLEGILSISGKPGLFKMVNQARNNLIVESLETKKRFPAFSTAKISALEDIAIFTEEQEVSLLEVFNNVFELHEGKSTISHKSSKEELVDFMTKILPEYDKDRVHISNMKKIVQWYNILVEKDILNDNAIEEYEKAMAEAEKEEEKEEN
jgi:hypothetical protein